MLQTAQFLGDGNERVWREHENSYSNKNLIMKKVGGQTLSYVAFIYRGHASLTPTCSVSTHNAFHFGRRRYLRWYFYFIFLYFWCSDTYARPPTLPSMTLHHNGLRKWYITTTPPPAPPSSRLPAKPAAWNCTLEGAHVLRLPWQQGESFCSSQLIGTLAVNGAFHLSVLFPFSPADPFASRSPRCCCCCFPQTVWMWVWWLRFRWPQGDNENLAPIAYLWISLISWDPSLWWRGDDEEDEVRKRHPTLICWPKNTC